MAMAGGNMMDAVLLQAARAMEEKVDEELAALEQKQASRKGGDDDDLSKIREARVAELKKAAARREEWQQRGHGEYLEIPDEKAFFKAMKKEERMVCHFYRENWPCKVMDKHLQVLCRKHFETKFCKIDAEKSPYLVDKLKIWMLPTLALIKNEKTVDYVVGFDDLGGSDDFSTETLEGRLAMAGLINENPLAFQQMTAEQKTSSVRASMLRSESDEDSDFDD